MYPQRQHDLLLNRVPLSPPDACLWSALRIYCFLCSLRRWSRGFRCHSPRIKGPALPPDDYFYAVVSYSESRADFAIGWSTVFIASALNRSVNRQLVTSRIRHCQLAPTTSPAFLPSPIRSSFFAAPSGFLSPVFTALHQSASLILAADRFGLRPLWSLPRSLTSRRSLNRRLCQPLACRSRALTESCFSPTG